MPRLSAVEGDDASPLYRRAPPLASKLEHVEAPVDPTSSPFKHAALADFDEALASFASSEMFRMCDVGDPWTTNDMDLSASSGQTRVDSPVYGRLGECVETDDNNPLSLPHPPPHPRYGHADSLVVPTDGKPWWSDPRESADVPLNATPSINPGLFTLTPAQRHQLQARQHSAYPPPRPPAPAARKRASRAADTPKRKRELGAKGFGEQKRGTRTTSKYRGVTHHCRTGRWEAHIWEDGKQVYLGGFDSEQQAALAYDVAAIKCRGEEASTNFDMNDYAQELAALNSVGKEELVLSLRRQSKGFVKGSSKFRGVTRHQKGRWEARIGQLVGRKYRYLGLYDQEEEAAVAYDTEAVRQKGFDAVTNFDLSEYADVLAEVSLFLFPYFYLLRTGNYTDVVFCLGVRVSAGGRGRVRGGCVRGARVRRVRPVPRAVIQRRRRDRVRVRVRRRGDERVPGPAAPVEDGHRGRRHRRPHRGVYHVHAVVLRA